VELCFDEETNVDVLSTPILTGERVGRYVIVNFVGSGERAVVYSAYDAERDRKVALKFLRPEATEGVSKGDAIARFVHEAQSVSRISHPNVVSVFEAGAFERGVFFAMEFVDGETLRAWQGRKGRSWREVLEAYVKAGRALSVAHGAGVLHRDFKPENVFVTTDGRVRVTDFGFARHDEELTPFDDQAIFCATLQEALGDAAPPWVKACLAQGLREAPSERFPSMSALLRALSRDPDKRRRNVFGGAALVVTLILMAVVTVRASAHPEPHFPTAEQKLAGTWDAARKDAVHGAFLETGLPFAEPTFRETERLLDQYARTWAPMHTRADVRADCLDERWRELRAVTDAFAAANEGTVKSALQIVQSLGPLDDCARPARSPLAGAGRTSVEPLRDRLNVFRIEGKSGEVREALEALKALQPEVEAAGDLRLKADLWVELGAMEFEAGHYDRSAERLYEAVQIAERAGDDRARARGWILLVRTLGWLRSKPDEGLRAAKFAEIAIHRAGAENELLAELDMSLSAAELQRGNAQSAQEHAKRALDAFPKDLATHDTRVAETLYLLAGSQARLGKREDALSALAWARTIWERTAGSDHPKVAKILSASSWLSSLNARHDEAIAAAERALAIVQKSAQPREVSRAHLDLGRALHDAERFGLADPHLQKALELSQKAADDYAAGVAAYTLAETRHREGFHRDAIDLCTKALRPWQGKDGPASPIQQSALRLMGESQLSLGSSARAIVLLERALSLATTTANPAEVARNQYALARALWATPGRRMESLRLAKSAKATWFGLNAPLYREDIARIDRWLDQRT